MLAFVLGIGDVRRTSLQKEREQDGEPFFPNISKGASFLSVMPNQHSFPRAEAHSDSATDPMPLTPLHNGQTSTLFADEACRLGLCLFF